MIFFVDDLPNDLRDRRRRVYAFMSDSGRIVQLGRIVCLVMLLEVRHPFFLDRLRWSSAGGEEEQETAAYI